MSTVEQVTDPDAEHGEGPVWHADWPGLRWVDMLAGDVCTLDHGTGAVTRRHVGSVAAALRPCREGGAVIAVERGFAFAEDDLLDVRPLDEVWASTKIRMNDGACDPDGRFYCGTMAYDETPGAGTLIRLNTDGSTTAVVHDVTISNGLAWSPDGSTAYYVDTPTQCIDAFDYVGGELTGRRTVVRIDATTGSPDGLTVDADGDLWVALWGGSAVHHYTGGGALVDVVSLPVPRVTACTFGGPGLDELYITTSRESTDLQRHPEAGAVFRARPGARGLPPNVFG